MKQSAFDDFSEGTMEAMYEAWDFKTCQRKDGTTYGVPDTSSCAQKGSKEVKGGGGGLTETRAKMAKSAAKFDKDMLKSLDRQSLEDLAYVLKDSGDSVDKEIAKLAQGRADKIRKGENQDKAKTTGSNVKDGAGNTMTFGYLANSMANTLNRGYDLETGSIEGREAGLAAATLRKITQAISKSENWDNDDSPLPWEKTIDKLKSKDASVRKQAIDQIKEVAKENGISYPSLPTQKEAGKSGYVTTKAEREAAKKRKEFEDGWKSRMPGGKNAPKSKTPAKKHTYNKQQTQDQYRNFYGMARAKGANHLTASDAAMSGLREKGFDNSFIDGRFRKKAAEESGYSYP